MMSTMAVMLAPGSPLRSGFYRIGEGLVMPGPLRAIGRDIDRVGRLCDESQMPFEILGEISQIETFASGSGIREIARLRRIYGRGRWRKCKGIARIRLPDGSVHLAELHWYETAGIGRKELKIKHLL
jgi:hypothetical protein